jgi:hypothetical protein
LDRESVLKHRAEHCCAPRTSGKSTGHGLNYSFSFFAKRGCEKLIKSNGKYMSATAFLYKLFCK